MKMKIRKGDTVQIISGNDIGKTGRVLEVYPKNMRILVEGINIRTKHEKPSQQNQKGGTVKKEMPVHYSNVMLLDSEKYPTRVGIRREERGGKVESVRYAKTDGKDL